MPTRTSPPLPADQTRHTGKPLGLQAYRAAVEDFVQEQLRFYTPRIEALPTRRDRAGKELNDAVWRTISLAPFEVVILDSPLLQRLRRVRQLGVVHWIYPSAGHCRLEHSIGAVHQVQRLLDSLALQRK